VLRLNGSPDCWFLGAQGCTLPAEVKPLLCRLFPVAYTEQGITGIEEECTARFPDRDVEALMRAIGMDMGAAEGWRAQLYRELREEQAQARALRRA